MSCQPYADAVVDPAAPRPPDLDAHLAACASCTALSQGHRAAEQLAGAELPAAPRLRPLVLVPRAALAAAALALLAVGARAVLRDAPAPAPVAGLATDPSPAPAAALPLEGTTLKADAPVDEEQGAWRALASLSAEVHGYARADATAHDWAAFQGLPQWFALERHAEHVQRLSEQSPAVEVPQESP